eukprot:3922033-Rhodomonas_salina.2
MSRLERKLSNESVVWPTLFLLGAAKAASSTFHLCTARSSNSGQTAKEVGILFATKIKVFLLSLYGKAPGGHDERCKELAQSRELTEATPLPDPHRSGTWTTTLSTCTGITSPELHAGYALSDTDRGRAATSFEHKMKAMIPANLHPQLRFLIVLREPVARAISQFNHQRAADCAWWCEHGPLDAAHFSDGFNASADFVARSLYAPDLERWFEAFDRRQFLVLNTRHLLSNTSDAMARVAAFLGVDPRPWEGMLPIESSHGRSKGGSSSSSKSKSSIAQATGGGEGAHGLASSSSSSSSSSSAGPSTHAATPPVGVKRAGGRISAESFECEELERFERLFAPHNDALYRLLARTKGRAPPEEPPFQPFADPRPKRCVLGAASPPAHVTGG